MSSASSLARLLGVAAALLLATSCTHPGSPGPAASGASTATHAEPAPSEAALSHVAVGVRRLEQFRYEDAQAAFEAALVERPGWTAAQVDLAIAHLNQLAPEQAALAEEAARKALAAAPGEPHAAYVLGYALAERDRKFDEALPLFRQVVKAAPSDAFAWYELGRSALEIAQAAEPLPGASGPSGLITAASGPSGVSGPSAGTTQALTDEAEQAFRKALALDPRFGEANYRLGRLLVESPDAARQAEGEKVLERHQAIMAGRPPVQQNYLTRGQLARAFPIPVPRRPPPTPAMVPLRPGTPLVVPPFRAGQQPGGIAPPRYRDGLTLVDLDRDGYVDILAPMRQVEQPVLLAWKGSHDGFKPPQAYGKQGSACASAPVADFDGDGDLDVFVTCNTGNVLLVNEGNVLADETVRTGLGGERAAGFAAEAVDFDHDGDLDLHVVAPLGGEQGTWSAAQHLFRNDGRGHFTDVAAQAGLGEPLGAESVVWSDFDGDNAIDMAAVKPGVGIVVELNDREGAFQVLPVAPLLRSDSAGPPVVQLAALDVDGDGDLDLVVVEGTVLRLFINDSTPGKLVLTEAGRRDLGRRAPGVMLVADMDLDGVPELVMYGAQESSPGGSGAAELLTVGDGAQSRTLVVRTIVLPDLDPLTAAVADLDGDGDPDLVGRTRSGAPVPIWNDLPHGPTWLKVRLAGRPQRSNPQGLGAKLMLDAGSLHQYVEYHSRCGALSHSLVDAAFGLGTRPAADGLSVLWPSGIRQAETELHAGAVTRIEELDRQPSSCPMLYGWNGHEWAFLTDCFSTAPLGLWVGPRQHVAGEPRSAFRLRAGTVEPLDGIVNVAVAEFLNESLLADQVSVVAADAPAGRTIVVDEGARFEAPAPDFAAWSLADPVAPVKATVGGRDVSAALAAEDDGVAGWTTATRFLGLAEPHALVVEFPSLEGVLVLTGSLNFPNSTNLYAAAQAGVQPEAVKLEIEEGGKWRTLAEDCGVPAGFHKDVVVDLRGKASGATTLRLSTNLQVSWDRVALYRDARTLPAGDLLDVPLARADKHWLGVPREVKGPENRWRSFPLDGLSGASDWRAQTGPATPDGDVSDLVTAQDGQLAILRPGDELELGFDTSRLPAPAAGASRVFIVRFHGWVKDADPHTAASLSVDPLPVPGKETYP